MKTRLLLGIVLTALAVSIILNVIQAVNLRYLHSENTVLAEDNKALKAINEYISACRRD